MTKFFLAIGFLTGFPADELDLGFGSGAGAGAGGSGGLARFLLPLFPATFKLNVTSFSSSSSIEKKSDSSVDVKPVADSFLPFFAGAPRAGLVADLFEPRPLPTLLAGDDFAEDERAGDDLASEGLAGDDPLVEGVPLGDLLARGNPPSVPGVSLFHAVCFVLAIS